MFKAASVFSSFAVDDIPAAKEFYSNVLGVEVTDAPMGMLQLKVSGDTTVMVYPKPGHQPAEFTILNLTVSNIDAAVDELARAGIDFIQYDTDQLKTDGKGVARSDSPDHGPNIAWFTDPAGNVIGLIEAP